MSKITRSILSDAAPSFGNVFDEPTADETSSGFDFSSLTGNLGTEDLTNIGANALRAGGNAFLGFDAISDAEDIQVAGYVRSDQGLRQQAAQAIALGQYNVELDRLKTARALEAKQRQFEMMVGAQRTQLAASGLRSSSQSFLEVSNEALTRATKDLLRIKEDADQRQENIMFSAASRENETQQRRQALQFQKEVDQYKAGVKKAKATGNFIKSAGSLLGGAFSGGGS